MDYTKHVNPRQAAKVTPQNKPIPGKVMVKNSAGGYSFKISDWDRLDRFLVLGSEGGTYYVGEKKLTKDNAKCIERLLKEDGVRVVNRIVEISDEGRAPSNDPALLALAMASAYDDVNVRRAALAVLPKVARTGTHLFHFVQFAQAFRGWGKSLRRATADWYNDKPLKDVEYQYMKYKQRDGWSHRDVLCKSHPKTDDVARNNLYKFIVSPETVGKKALSERLQASEETSRSDDSKRVISLIKEFNLPREVINTSLLNNVKVWEALLEDMPITALIRNLGKMTSVGLVKPLSDASKKIVESLADQNFLSKGRVHPIAVLGALGVYREGHGERGKLVWTPDQNICDALDRAFYLTFKNVTPTGKRFLLGLDISGSMTSNLISGMPGITPRVGAAAMALVTMAVESQTYPMGFTDGEYESQWSNHYQKLGSGMTPLSISPRQRIDDVCKYMESLKMGGTNCAVPMIHAEKERLEVDAFVIYTDNETWAGKIHPKQALDSYRNKMGIPAKCVVVAMTSTPFTIADPDDSGMFDVVGFDSATPNIISDLVK